MASKCPNCGRHVKWYEIKADCPECGVSMPNFNWEARLEEDNKKAEEQFEKFHRTLCMLKYTVVGTKLRIARLVMSLLPALGFILPWAAVSSAEQTLNFEILGIFTKGTNLLQFVPGLIKDLDGVVSAVTTDGFANPVTCLLSGLLLMLLSIIAIVVAFFLIFIKFRKFKTKAVWIADIVSIIFAAASAVVFSLSASAVNLQHFTFGGLTFENASAGALWGIYVYIVLLAVAFVANLLVSKADVRTVDDLLEERNEKARLKEEKLEAEKQKKELAKKETEARARKEQEEKVQKAREALENQKKK